MSAENREVKLMRNRLETLVIFGGAEEDRTPDLRIANATLSQLSYGPTEWGIIRVKRYSCQAVEAGIHVQARSVRD